ncbi:MAG: hypothetical protein K2F72_04700, partial [Muribaculaceae bacterium]|nr:hypothetical protein [Muribaculaceae bacterium]
MMKHFTFRLLLLMVALVSLSVLSFSCFIRGLWPQGALAAIAALVTGCVLMAHVRRLATLVSAFMKSIL